jgi:hypothetical protein
MSTKHPKTTKPSDKDLIENPMIGGSKGVTMSQSGPDDLADMAGANTIEGDVENDTNRHGGIDKSEGRNQRRTPHI